MKRVFAWYEARRLHGSTLWSNSQLGGDENEIH